MAQDLTLFRNGAMQRSSVFDAVKGEEHKLSAGVGPGFARITYRGGKWGIRYQGETTMARRYVQQGNMMVDDGPNPKLDIIILDVSETPSKYYYIGAFNPESATNPPDCWSTNGITPDSGAPRKQSPTCAGCPHNAWGSAKRRDDNTPSRGKACTDHKRLAVVPVSDITNKAYGGPMLLLVPPTSLKLLAPYEQKLARGGFRFFEVWTQLSFDDKATFPLFEFDAIRPLNDKEGMQVLEMRKDDLVKRILTTEVEGVEGYDQPEYATPTGSNEPPAPNPPPVNAPQPMPSSFGPPPPPAPNPPAAPQQTQPAEAPPADPAATLAALLKSLSPAQIAALGLGSAPKKRGPRTPAPSPRPMDTTPQQTAQTPPVNDNGEDDNDVAGIMSTIENLIPRE